MEKKKIRLGYIFLVVFFILLIAGAIKTLNNHHDKEYLVINNKILESAKNCYKDNACEGEVTIKDLYEKNYLDKLIDPLTKEDYDDSICIKYENKKALFCK